MLNVEKYLEAIMSEDVDTNELDCHIAVLRGIKDCGNCECDGCMRESFRWLFSEYEPPLLKNGDGLKPGDKIMVRDNNGQEWAQATYLFYFNEAFYCVDGVRYIAEAGIFVNWLQARLPEDGE